MKVWTIGYEGRALPEFLELLREAGITALADVRRTPLSRKKGFSKGTLKKALEEVDIRYEPLPELGIAPERRKAVRTPAQREALFEAYERELPRQKEALDRLRALIRGGERVALLCFERDPADCHRSRLARGLSAQAQDL
jgi:uncharacterized protein (DUF488 family)